jgi:hypothetical protein
MTHNFTSRAALLAMVVALVGVTSGVARSDDAGFVTGSGIAYAQFVRVGPTAARLSLAPTLGLSLSDYAGSVGRGQATDADLAAIGVAQPCLAAEIPTVRVVSTDKNADKGKTEFFAGSRDASGKGGGAGELYALANGKPYGQSHFRLGSFQIPGVLSVGEGYAATTAGVVRNGVREATATVEISSFDFAGAISLAGLRWEAVQQSSAKGRKVTSTFTVAGATIGGFPLPIPAGSSDLQSILGPLNAALAPTGFALRPPANDSEAGVASMSPLSIEIVNSPLGRQTLAPALGAIQPIREPLANALIPILKAPADATGPPQSGCGGSPQAPDLSVGVLLADLTLGIFAGSSDMHIELGGVNAYTEGQRYSNPFLGTFGKLPVVNNSVETITKPGLPGSPAIPGTTGMKPSTLAVSPATATQHTTPGTKGGTAMMVGAFGLLAAILLAAADWYRMRLLQR